MKERGRTLIRAAIGLAAAGAVTACAGFQPDTTRQPGQSRDSGSTSNAGGGVSIFGLGGGHHSDAQAPAEIGVNSYLWRAALDTLAFMPLASADPFGGVIITDWHSDSATPNERFKATVYILDTKLRADALNVSLFRQEMHNGVWQDAAVNPDTAAQIENAILRRARELRLSAVGNGH